ncbi:MAG: potassium transporter [Deltaproteobacteria bacterium HGW-Deltaproteobacteria-12]|jgi:CPA2 family monovalent cation:H+ antiporter-2|nr:MAG: potassium transporter [Deltaproteobacteria bacterium HGW-Deltaproteobacteria-12]
MSSAFLYDALIYLAAAVVFVPVAKKLGMGSVLGYIIGGIIIGPFFLGFVGQEGKDIMHFAEFGVVMMLFLAGLELDPATFWRMRKLILGAGSVQMAGTTLLSFFVFLLLGFSWQAAVAIGLAVSMSSTAIIMQSFRERGLTKTQAARGALAVSLFQDVSVIPILALLPLLAISTSVKPAVGPSPLIEGMPGWAQTLTLLIAANAVMLAGRFVFVPFLRFIAGIHLREIFTASALLIIIGISYLMIRIGFSPALGAFLAGVVLATSEFRHELESDIEPFKGVLLGLFFIAVGASINFSLILQQPLLIMGIVVGIILIKLVITGITGKIFGLSFDQNMLFTVTLSQVGEFAFVLFGFTHQLHLLSASWTDIMMGVTATSMGLTPVLLLLNERFILPYFGTKESPQKNEPDVIREENPVIIAGFGHFGSTIGRFLRASGINTTILDNDSDRVDLLRKMGFTVFYGDATRLDILKSAGADQARILIAAIDSPEINLDLIDRAKKEFPNLTVMVRAKSRLDAYELLDAGVENIYRESLDTSVRLGVDALIKLGFRRYSATRAGQKFIKYDEGALRLLAAHRHDQSSYIFQTREQISIQEELLTNDREAVPNINDHAWESDVYKEQT